MKLLQTIRLDPSDTVIFPSAAEPGEWAISGAFVFGEVELAALRGKKLAAFRNGLLGIPSLGWSTLAQIVEVDAKNREAAIDLVAKCLLDRFGAPDFAIARKAAVQEIDFATSLCDHPAGTLIAVHRSDQGGAIHEAFRRLQPQGGFKRWRAFPVIDVGSGDEPIEPVDLAAVARGEGG